MYSNYFLPQQSKKKAFISFDFDNDEDIKNLLVAQAKNPDSPFEIIDKSIKQPFPELNWEDKCFERIKKCDVVIVLVGEKTLFCDGVLKEIEMARQARIPYFGLHGRNNRNCLAPPGLGSVYDWTWPNVKALIDGAR